MFFAFKPKNQALNWDQVVRTDLKTLIQSTDLQVLEQLLGNITDAQLSKADLVKFGDKNLTKLFKVGQLSLEYLLFLQQYSEAHLAHTQQLYKADAQIASELEKEALKLRQEHLNLKADVTLKRHTLDAYEQMLKKPLGKAQVFKCVLCFKYFKDNAFLQQHYERRHLEFYKSERHQRQQQLNQGQLEAQDLIDACTQQRDDFFEKCKTEVIGKYSNNLLALQTQLQGLTNSNNSLIQTHSQLQEQVTVTIGEANYSVKEYQQNIEDLKLQINQQIANQREHVARSVEEALLQFKKSQEAEKSAEQSNQSKGKLEQMERESELQQKISQEIEDRLQREFDARVKQLLVKLEEKEGTIKSLRAQAELQHQNKEIISVAGANLSDQESKQFTKVQVRIPSSDPTPGLNDSQELTVRSIALKKQIQHSMPARATSPKEERTKEPAIKPEETAAAQHSSAFKIQAVAVEAIPMTPVSKRSSKQAEQPSEYDDDFE